MPIYEYRCGICGQKFELRRSLADSDSEIRCPGCQAEHPERLISASYLVGGKSSPPGTTCCGREERCDAPPCSTDDVCRRR